MTRTTSVSTAPNPERWSTRPLGGSPDGPDQLDQSQSDRFGAAFRTVAAATEFQPVRSMAAARARPVRRRLGGAVVTAAVVLTTGAGAWAAWTTHSWMRARAPAEPTAAPTSPNAAPVVARRDPPSFAPDVPDMPVPVPAPVPEPVAPRRTPRAPAVSPPSETALLAQAFRSLRNDRDASAALVALDQHASRYPLGALRPEADVARVEALLLLGRSADALAVLDGLRPAANGSRRAILMRAELRASFGRCREALTDFDQVLTGATADEPGERALRGRAACRARLGDQTGARADLDLYLRRFPTTPFAAELRRQQGTRESP